MLFLVAVSGLYAQAAGPVQIGGRSEVSEVAIEVDEASGNLLAVLRYDTATDGCFSVNLSTDEGVSWTETHEECSPHGIGDHVGTAVVDGMLYVGWISQTAVDSARVLRLATSDGAHDSGFGSPSVFSAGVGDDICHVALASNHASYDDRLYLFAITEGVLKLYWTDQDGGAGANPWQEIATGVSDAWCWMLEAAYNDGYWLGSDYSPLVAYQSGWDLYLWRYHGGTGAEHFLFDAALPVFERPGSIAVSHDEMRAVYWSYSYQTKSCESAAAGAAPSCELWEDSDSDFAGDVVAAPGGGFGAVYAPDNGECLVRVDSGAGQWSESAQCHHSVPDLRGPLAIAAVKPFTPFNYGIVATADDPQSGSAFFVRSPLVFLDGFESGGTTLWSASAP